MSDPAEESATPDENLSELEPFELFDGDTSGNEQELAIIPDLEELTPLDEIVTTELIVDDQQPVTELPDVPIVDEPVGVDLCVDPISEPNTSNDNLPDVPPEIKDETIVNPEVSVIKETKDENSLNSPDLSEDKEEIPTEEHSDVRKTLNETLGKPQQSKDDVLSPEKSDSGYPVMPINSIWDGIGINDRFLYIRELFANSSAKFETTINALDKLDTIQDAVNFLKLNFKWAKTDASQKFLVLVKRRFTK